MSSYMSEEGYSDHLLKKIQSMWEENLKKAPRSKFAHIIPLKHLHASSMRPVIKIEPKREPSPEAIVPPSNSASNYSDSEEELSELREEDPNLKEFEFLKQAKQELLKVEENKVEEESSVSDELPESDEDTNLEEPDPNGVIHCLHDGVKRKGSTWTIGFKNCVFQECGKSEKFFRTATSKFEFRRN